MRAYRGKLSLLDESESCAGSNVYPRTDTRTHTPHHRYADGYNALSASTIAAMQNAATPIPAGYGTISKPAGLGLDYGTQSFLMTAMLDTALAAGTDATQLAATNGVCVCVCVCLSVFQCVCGLCVLLVCSSVAKRYGIRALRLHAQSLARTHAQSHLYARELNSRAFYSLLNSRSVGRS